MRILVTGGAGFIGSHIAEYFSGKANIRVLDNLRSGYLENLEGFDCEFIKGSNILTKFQRYASPIDNSLYKAIIEFDRLQERRLKREVIDVETTDE